MATIRTAIQLYDSMSPALRSMNKALNIVLNSFEAMQTASSNSVDTSDIRQARDELARVETTLDGVEDNIRRANEQQQRFNEEIRNGANAASDIKSKFMGLVGVIGSLVGIKKVLDLSDTLTQTTARLNMMNDGMQTTEELQQMIFAAAQRSRGSYQDSADAVAKMGIMAKDAFNSNAELVAFVEQLNKQFTIAGTSQEGISAAMLQLTQAMGSGVLRGEELNSVFEQAPTIIQSIADYLDVPIGQIRNMAAEGQITADIVKNALFEAAEGVDGINARFENMPKTVGQVMQSVKNQALMTFQPILEKINEIVNSDKFNNMVTGAIGAITTLAAVAVGAFNALASVAGFVYDNWSWIEPIIWGVIAAFVAYNAVALISNGIIAAQALVTSVKAAADAMASGATFLWTVQQHGLNAALLACPLTWIIILIIAAIIGVCQWIAKATGVANSWFGVMTGGINVVIQFFKNLGLWVANIALGIWEAIGACCSNIGTAFHNTIANVQGWFYGLLSTALRVVEGICAALNKLPFVEFDYSGITAKADEYAAKSAEAYGSKQEYKSVADAFNSGFSTFDAFGDGWASDAFKAGASWGDGVADKVSGFFSGGDGSSLDAFNLGSTLDGVYSNTGDTAGNTAQMADSLSATEEDLKYLRDIAERETINRFTTAEITIEQTNNNTISSDMDIDGVMEKWNADFTEILETAAEGVHE